MNFGAPGFELVIDGHTQTSAGSVTMNDEAWNCGSSPSPAAAQVGINGGIPKPWTVGAGETYEAATGGAKIRYYTGGAIDHFRVSAARFPSTP